MRGNERVEIRFLHARRRAARREAVDDAVLVPPVARDELAGDAALVAGSAVRIVQPVVGAEAGERRRRHDAHPPLRHAEIRLAQAADFSVGPRLRRKPLDHVVQIALLVRPEKLELSARRARAADVHVHVGIALLHIEIDRAGLAPEELRSRRQHIVVVAVRRGREQRGIAAAAFGRIDRGADLRAVANGDGDFAHRHGLSSAAGGLRRRPCTKSAIASATPARLSQRPAPRAFAGMKVRIPVTQYTSRSPRASGRKE